MIKLANPDAFVLVEAIVDETATANNQNKEAVYYQNRGKMEDGAIALFPAGAADTIVDDETVYLVFRKEHLYGTIA